MSPMWNRQNTCPTRSDSIMCRQRSRTVAGLPAMTNPFSTRSFHVSFWNTFCCSARSWFSFPPWIVLSVR